MATHPYAGLVLAGFDGTEANDPIPARLAELGVGGFILFGRNVQSPAQVHRLLAGLREASGDRPLLLAVDQEGGRVARLRAPLTVWPPMQTLGDRGDPALARSVGQALGAELAAVGFNLDFAPVLDVRFEGTTIAIGDRALSDDPARVSELGSALIAGLQAAGLLACAKHFPGHGYVTVDSHVALPVCDLPGDVLRRDHVAPFAVAIDAGVDCVMSAHVVYPALDGDAPATLSSACLTTLLRKELGFSGVVLTDDLEMGAIVGEQGIGAAAVRAIRAGVDGLLVCRRLDFVGEVLAALAREASEDPAFANRCDESLERLRRLALSRPPRPVAASALEDHVGTTEHRALAERVRASQLAQVGADPTEQGA